MTATYQMTATYRNDGHPARCGIGCEEVAFLP